MEVCAVCKPILEDTALYRPCPWNMDTYDLRLEYREIKAPLMLDYCGTDRSSPFCFGCQKTQLNCVLRSSNVWNTWTSQPLLHILQGKLLWLPKSGKEADFSVPGVRAFLLQNIIRLTVSFPFSQHTHTHTHTYTHCIFFIYSSID